ncbi:vacuolar protein sorting-associated protein 36 [Moniliophthora roreri MCA 2997]|uniref:Vacuolar protein-sorting-associated protein 36 n=2 Tax=Moniliophthora roreri TaxID=221103 RepID=V2WRJ2_MONRO|nr:vacuolar protein sorting-associated protein 36 [Moniliophthora roreri MCA 2997]KAI3609857.1 vacuolar protein sorting-associated protein 36 [Moniliophthora roreri]
MPSHTQSVDGTIPVQALLYSDEELVASQEWVGIYDGLQKSINHQSGTVHATTHRLFYIDQAKPRKFSFELDLGLVVKTEYYAGLFKSSPKVTLHLASPSDGAVVSESWECQVCAFRNPPGLSPSAAKICALCGVPRSSQGASSSTSDRLSSSLPSSSTPNLGYADRRARKLSSIPCPTCTFLNHPALKSCEICESPLPDPSASEMKSAPASRPDSPDIDDEASGETIMKISFRKGGDKTFYAELKRSLKGKAWEAMTVASNRSMTPAGASSNGGTAGDLYNKSGISGIIQSVQNTSLTRETHMQDALKDLEALMVKAKDMVRLAAELNERLTAVTSTTTTATPSSSSTVLITTSTEPESATFIRSSLAQLGLTSMANAPVTLEMVKDERRWFEELAKELAGVLQGGLIQSQGGIIALDQVWGGWNRARGVALIPPSTLLQVIPLLDEYTDPPIRVRELKDVNAGAAGLKVLYIPKYSVEEVTKRLTTLLRDEGSKTTTEIAQSEGITIALAQLMIGEVEMDTGSPICRDDWDTAVHAGGVVVGETRWWANVFSGYAWDGHEL